MICKKCNSIASVTLRKKDNYCEECFSASTNHKFRSCLGKNKVLMRHDTVLLALSGGKGSMVLLDLVHNGITLDTHKTLRMNSICLYLCGLIPDQHQDSETAQSLINVCNLHKLDLYVVNVSQYFEKDLKLPAANVLTEIQQKPHEILKSKQQKLNPTELIDFKTKLMRNLFIRIAKTLECNHVFTAETTTTLARNLLSNIVLGRGSQIENDVGFSDSRDENIKIFRPLKDISMEELVFYAEIKKITIPEQENNCDLSSMQSLIQSFVVNLQENFQATISTVCKTADKIGTKGHLLSKTLCQLCQSDISVNSKLKMTSHQATNFSSSICHGLVKDDDVLFAAESNVPVKYYCYGCSKVIN